MHARPILPFREVQGELDAVLAIEIQQDDLLRRLEELNARIEQVLAEHGAMPAAPTRGEPQAA